MNFIKKYPFLGAIILVATLSVSGFADQNQQGQDVFVPIEKYVANGDAESLSAWFTTSLEIDILGKTSISSKQQAKQILKDFFNANTPRSFSITYRSGKAPMKYAVGSLSAGGSKFRVTIFVKTTTEGNFIENIRIEKE